MIYIIQYYDKNKDMNISPSKGISIMIKYFYYDKKWISITTNKTKEKEM